MSFVVIINNTYDVTILVHLWLVAMC